MVMQVITWDIRKAPNDLRAPPTSLEVAASSSDCVFIVKKATQQFMTYIKKSMARFFYLVVYFFI